MPGKENKQIAFALYPGASPLDLVGPLSVLRDLKLRTPYRTVVVGERLEPAATDASLAMIPAKTFAEIRAPFGLFVPGAGPAITDAMKDEALLGYVRSAAETAEVVGSIGNGALLLGAAGLLEGRQVAIHWAYAELLENLGATCSQERWVEDGKFLTAAGGSAGIDMMLHLVAKLTSQSRARLTQLFVEYDPQPPFGSIDRSLADDLTDRFVAQRDNPTEAISREA